MLRVMKSTTDIFRESDEEIPPLRVHQPRHEHTHCRTQLGRHRECGAQGPEWYDHLHFTFRPHERAANSSDKRNYPAGWLGIVHTHTRQLCRGESFCRHPLHHQGKSIRKPGRSERENSRTECAQCPAQFVPAQSCGGATRHLGLVTVRYAGIAGIRSRGRDQHQRSRGLGGGGYRRRRDGGLHGGGDRHEHCRLSAQSCLRVQKFRSPLASIYRLPRLHG